MPSASDSDSSSEDEEEKQRRAQIAGIVVTAEQVKTEAPKPKTRRSTQEEGGEVKASEFDIYQASHHYHPPRSLNIPARTPS